VVCVLFADLSSLTKKVLVSSKGLTIELYTSIGLTVLSFRQDECCNGKYRDRHRLIFKSMVDAIPIRYKETYMNMEQYIKNYQQ
jgi:hypothetical protein